MRKLQNTLRSTLARPRPSSPRFASRAVGRGSYFLIFPSTHTSGRATRRHRSTARFTMSNLSGKMHRVSRLPAAFPTLSKPRDAARAATIPHAVGAQRYPRASPFIYARENAELPRQTRIRAVFSDTTYLLPLRTRIST